MTEKPTTPRSNGLPITSEMIEEYAAEAEAGYDIDEPRDPATATVVSVQLDPELHAALNAQCHLA
jgi:hypothetical protein